MLYRLYTCAASNLNLKRWDVVKTDCEAGINLFQQYIPDYAITPLLRANVSKLHFWLSSSLATKGYQKNSHAIIDSSEKGFELIPESEWRYIDLTLLAIVYDGQGKWNQAINWYMYAYKKATRTQEKQYVIGRISYCFLMKTVFLLSRLIHNNHLSP